MCQSFDLCCILHMAINKRAEIQLNGIKSGIPVSPTTPPPHSPLAHAPVYKCPCASISPHRIEQYRPEQNRPEQTRTDQNSSLKWSRFTDHALPPTNAPMPVQLSYLCAREIGNWGFRIVVGMSEHYNRITSTKTRTCYTPINWYELRHTHTLQEKQTKQIETKLFNNK